MKIEYDDFIGLYRDVYPPGYCKHLISEFERLEELGAGSNRQKSENVHKHIKNDYQILTCMLREHSVRSFGNEDPIKLFFDGLQQCFESYTDVFSSIKGDPIRATAMKMQKTSPGGGYHVWHPEQGPGELSRRVLTYMVYLNSLPKDGGGETEFLYQRKRYHPEENLMLIWPASYTHTHRGNLILCDEYKYIVTGWFLFD